ncbi:hypothetical protein QE422_000845 [Chryseobacterium sp. SORGH_AS 447]|uniref:hypothetical protein n=1 Tax=Chryseobacterium sp. SORGH_AS_0447 TaxID=3041769 RepID=UPI002783FA2D|nr:hypothetical protein [Chryseobacterium sp. SORGH_AS_0447]MDQ1160477.1 hypothetical protein [Chryseobacterium sp. SORGH_AS_0447]
MRKKLVFRLSLLIVLLTTLYSCRNEFIDYERRTDQIKQSYTAKQLNYEQLKQQSPTVAEKIAAFKTLSGLKDQNSRTYIDSEEEFSVDTEKSIYIEDEKGHKTYTFKIERKETNLDILENLVLSDLGNSEFEAFISSYDKVAIESLDKFTLEDLKKHITIAPIGKRNGTDIFGKYMANPCQIMVPSFVNIYVPGTICCHGIHNYSQIGSCTCTGNGLPTDSYSYTGISYDLFNTCDGGGASPGNGPVVTGPYNGNNPGGGFGGTTTTDNPCNKIKNSLLRNVINTNPATNVKGLLIDLKTNKLPSVNPQITGETVYAIFQNPNNTDWQYQIFEEDNVEHQVEPSLGPGYIYPVFMHTHKVDALTIFSLADIFAIKDGIDNGNFNENTVFYLVTDNGTQYAMTITDLNSFTSWANFYFAGWEFDNIKKMREDDYEKKVNLKNTIDQNENGLAEFFDTKFAGVQLIKSSTDFSTWQQLIYNPLTNKTNKTNCPN